MRKWMAIGGLVLVTIIWGGGFTASDIALESMTPFQYEYFHSCKTDPQRKCQPCTRKLNR